MGNTSVVVNDFVRILSVLLKQPQIREERENYMSKNEDREEYDMCLALREWAADKRAEGRAEGATRMFALIAKMMEASETDKVLMLSNKEFPEEMHCKYNL